MRISDILSSEAEDADFIVSRNNGVFAVYPAKELVRTEKIQGAYWIEAGKCFSFSDEKRGCLHGDSTAMEELLRGKKVVSSEGIWSSLYVPFSNCWREGSTGAECIGKKIQRIIEHVLGKSEEQINQEIFKDLLLQAITIPEVKEETARKLGKELAEIAIFPASTVWGMLHLVRFCQKEQKFRLDDSELLKYK